MSTLALMGLLLVTLIVYMAMYLFHQRIVRHSLAHPLILSVLLLTAMCLYLDISISQFQLATASIHWFLGPITVALAIPVFQQWHAMRALGLPVLVSILIGGLIAPVLAWGVLAVTDIESSVQLTFLVKSITTPLAMGAAEEIGGIPSLAAVIVIVTGIVGATLGRWVFSCFAITDKRAQGIALGAVAHAVGTAKAVSESSQTGAFASVALCVNGVVTALILPFLFWLLTT